MGLHVTAYSELVPGRKDSELNITESMIAHSNSFGKRCALSEGRYDYKAFHDFPAGTYGGYNRFRDQLARAAGYESADSVWENNLKGPLSELINFSDCYGVLDSATSEKLAGDFNVVSTQKIEDIRFMRVFNDFHKAFALAADGGCVVFS